MSPVGIIINQVLNGLGVWQVAQGTIWIWTAIGLGVFFVCIISMVYSQHRRLSTLEIGRSQKQVSKNQTDQVNVQKSPVAEQPDFTMEQIAERLSFIQKLQATEDQLVKDVHYNIPDSAAYFFNKFCEEPNIRTIIQQDGMITIAVRLITERFQILTLQCLELQARAKQLTASTITDDDISYACNKIGQTVFEYRQMVDEWMKFMETLGVKGIPRIWEVVPWSVNIHIKLADNYDELMRLIKELHNGTPRQFQTLFHVDELTKFPRGSLLS